MLPGTVDNAGTTFLPKEKRALIAFTLRAYIHSLGCFSFFASSSISLASTCEQHRNSRLPLQALRWLTYDAFDYLTSFTYGDVKMFSSGLELLIHISS